eukprot:379089-Rhodomonas_salina.2
MGPCFRASVKESCQTVTQAVKACVGADLSKQSFQDPDQIESHKAGVFGSGLVTGLVGNSVKGLWPQWSGGQSPAAGLGSRV